MLEQALTNVDCPSCGNRQNMCVGAIPVARAFAGRKLPRPLPGGILYRCKSCYLFFRYPRLTKDELDALYQQGESHLWQHEPGSRKDWSIATNMIKGYSSSGRVLDVGCFDGGFLALLGDSYQRFGIEIHSDAAHRAQQRGIQIIGSDFDVLKTIPSNFDVVVAMDVIEHVIDPQSFLKALVKATRSQGFIILSTGNSEAPSWRFMGSRYWYCTLAEHISFINPRWCRNTASTCGLVLETIERFSHFSGHNRLFQQLTDFSKNALYKLAPQVAASLRKKGDDINGVSKYDVLDYQPPGWQSAKDHFMVVFRKI